MRYLLFKKVVKWCYLNKISKFNYDVISSGELYSFAEFKKIKNFSKDIISNFIEVFKYKRIDICLLNRYTSFFIELINSCNIECSYIERSTRYKDYFENNDTSIFDVFLFSDSESGGGYCEKENVINLINYIELLQKYKQITGSYLTHNKYITECVDYLYKLKNKGFDGFLQETKSYWQNEFHKKIEEKGNLEVINSLENTNSGKRYIDAYQNIYKVPDKNFYVSIKFFLCIFVNMLSIKCLLKNAKMCLFFLLCLILHHFTTFP